MAITQVSLVSVSGHLIVSFLFENASHKLLRTTYICLAVLRSYSLVLTDMTSVHGHVSACTGPDRVGVRDFGISSRGHAAREAVSQSWRRREARQLHPRAEFRNGVLVFVSSWRIYIDQGDARSEILTRSSPSRGDCDHWRSSIF